MPIIAFIAGLLFPRITIVLLWLFTPWFTGVFQTKLWPLFGLLFLPLTLLWYSAVHHWFGGDWNWWRMAILVIAILCDLGLMKGAK